MQKLNKNLDHDKKPQTKCKIKYELQSLIICLSSYAAVMTLSCKAAGAAGSFWEAIAITNAMVGKNGTGEKHREHKTAAIKNELTHQHVSL